MLYGLQIIKIRIADVLVGERHRKDMGNLDGLARSIDQQGLLQPIGITLERELVFGERRLRACRDILGWAEIEARFVNVTSAVEGEHDENELRKQFTTSERVAILQRCRREIQRRQGARTDLGQNIGRSRIADEAAHRAGFGNRETARLAEQVVDKGVPELVEAMDKGEVAISCAAQIAKLPATKQRNALKAPKANCQRAPDPFAAAKDAQVRDAKNVGDFDRAEALISALEALYRDARPLVRQRVRDRLWRVLDTIDQGDDRLHLPPSLGDGASRPH